MISPDFEENPGDRWVSEMAPFLLANRGWGLLIFRVKLRVSGGRLETMPKMGHILPRLGYKMGALPDGDRLPMISPDFEENPG